MADDPSDSDHISLKWWSVIQDHAKGRRIHRDELLAALADSTPIPDEAKPLLADLMSGARQFARGPTPHWKSKNITSHWHTNMMVDCYREWVEAVIDDPDSTEGLTADSDPKKKAIFDRAAQEATSGAIGRMTPHQAALELTALDYGVSANTIASWLQQWRNLVGKNRTVQK